MKRLSKFISLILAVMMILSSYSVVSFAGATTPTLPVCTQHRGGQATCQAKANCSVCGTQYGDFGGHVFSDSSDSTCNLCDYVRTITDSPTICLNHKYSSDCDITCNNCGKTRQTNTDHTFDNGMDAECNHCGFVRDLGDDPQSPSICFQHRFDDCLDTDCNACGFVRPAETHSGGTATCKAQAICTKCGASYGEFSDHAYDDESDAQCNECGFVRDLAGDPESPSVCFQHTYDGCTDAECNVCGFIREAKAHTGGTATCKAKAVCSLCGYSYGELGDHSYKTPCDADCDLCGNVRTPADHEYTDWDDSSCNICGENRDLPNMIPGDANRDGKVDQFDFDLIQQYINGWNVTVNLENSDFNKDGKINNKDLGLVQRLVLGLDLDVDFGDGEDPGNGDDDGGGTQRPGSGVIGGTDLWN